MNRVLFLFSLLFLFFAPANLSGAAYFNPLDLSGMNKFEALQHLNKLTGRTIEVSGVLKEAGELKSISSSMIYEIPVYSREGGVYKRQGYVCQREGLSKIFFAEDGFLSMYVRKNALGKAVLAKGRLEKNCKGLPEGMVFIIDSLNLQEER
jgi:hypothetical protein